MGLLDKARYYRMGFRDKAHYWLKKWGLVDIPKNDESPEDQTSNFSSDAEINSPANTILERKIHDVNTLFEIGKELNSSLEVEELLDIILLTCMGQMGLEQIAILIRNEKEFSLKAQRGFEEIEPDKIVIPKENDFFNFANSFSNVISFAEIESKFLENDILNIFKLLKTEIIVPLIAKGEINGLILIGKKMNKVSYSHEEKEFLFMLATMAGIAVDNATLYSNLKKANNKLDKNYKELSTLYEISKIINSSDNLEEVLRLALETMTTGFGVQCASICLYNEEKQLTINASIGLSEKTIEKFIIKADNAAFSLLMETGETENFEDFKSLSEITNLFDPSDLNNLDFFITIPLICSEQKLGLLNIHKINQNEDSNEKDLKLFSLFASQISPPILSTKILDKTGINKLDLYSPIIQRLETEINLARDFDVSLTVILLRIQGAPNIQEEEAVVLTFITLLNETLKEGQSYFRYGKSRFLLLLPNLHQDDAFNFMNLLKNRLRNEKEWIGLEFSTVNFPEDGTQARELLFKIE